LTPATLFLCKGERIQQSLIQIASHTRSLLCQEEEQKETIRIDYVSSHIGTFYLVDLPDDISLEISLEISLDTSKGFQTDIIDIDVR